MKIVFMGTPDFSVYCLDALVKAGHEIAAVFTQPDKPKNRGHKIQMPPVKEYAVEKGLDVYQPLSLRKGDDAQSSFEKLESINPDVIVVVAYGQFLPENILNLPKYGCINVHASLLPKYRGAAPIQYSIINGETKTGVTTMYMAKGIDTGDMLMKSEVDITRRMNGEQLHDLLAQKGAELIVKTLEAAESGTLSPEKQDDSLSCYAPKLEKETCVIDFDKNAETIYNLIRGLSTAPCAFSFLSGKRIKVYSSEITDEKSGLPAGTIIKDNTLDVACGDGKVIRMLDVQLEGGKRLSAEEFLRGRKTVKGDALENG